MIPPHAALPPGKVACQTSVKPGSKTCEFANSLSPQDHSLPKQPIDLLLPVTSLSVEQVYINLKCFVGQFH